MATVKSKPGNRKIPKASKNVGGRPSKKTDDVVGKLEDALKEGFTVSMACYLSGINRDTYYSWLETDPDFSDKMTRAQDWFGERSRQALGDLLFMGDPTTVRWYLERKYKSEFSSRAEITGPDGRELESGKTFEALAAIADALKGLGHDGNGNDGGASAVADDSTDDQPPEEA